MDKKRLYVQGYRLVGNHSAIKVCLWTKKAIRGQDVCYKCTFYGINTHRCVQMTPAMNVCTHRCRFCWRSIEHTLPEWEGPIDDPKDIVDGCIKEHIKYLKGFGGSRTKDNEKYEESMAPLHFAISLSGEPTFYPRLPELIEEIHSRGMTSFLVSNGTNPEMIRQLIEKQPTQLYMTLPAPDKESYNRVCAPLIKDGWERIRETLGLLSKFKRSTIRLTLAKGLNMHSAEKYAKLIKEAKPKFVELKAYMWVGSSTNRMEIGNMPLHSEIMDFAKEIAEYSGMKIVDEKKESRVALLMHEDKERKLYLD